MHQTASRQKFDQLMLLTKRKRVTEVATAVAIDFQHPRNEPLNQDKFLPTLPFPLAIYGLDRLRNPTAQVWALARHTRQVTEALIAEPDPHGNDYQSFSHIPFALREMPDQNLPPALDCLYPNDPYSILCMALDKKPGMYHRCKSYPAHYLQLISDMPQAIEQNKDEPEAPFEILKQDPRLAIRWLAKKTKFTEHPLEDTVVRHLFEELLSQIERSNNEASLYCRYHLKPDPQLRAQLVDTISDPVLALQIAYEDRTQKPKEECLNSSPKWIYNRLFILKDEPTPAQETLLCNNAPWGIQYIEDCRPAIANQLLNRIVANNTNPAWSAMITHYQENRVTQAFDPFEL